MDTIQSKIHKTCAKPLKMTSIEETIQLARLQQAANSSSLYERKTNQKALKVLTVAAYILFVSMAAIILSFYYVFIWDPTTKTMAPRPSTNCGKFMANTNRLFRFHSLPSHSIDIFVWISETAKKIVIPESIAIRLANSSEVSAEYFFRDIYRRYQQLQKQERRERQRSSKKTRLHQPPTSLVNRDRKIVESIRSTASTMETSSVARNSVAPIQTTTISNSFVVQTKDQAAYVDDEDLETDLEASGSNRIRNDTSIAYHFDDTSENEN